MLPKCPSCLAKEKIFSSAFTSESSALARPVNFFTGFKSSNGATPAKLLHVSPCYRAKNGWGWHTVL